MDNMNIDNEFDIEIEDELTLSKQRKQFREKLKEINGIIFFKNNKKGESYSNINPSSVFTFLELDPDTFFAEETELLSKQVHEEILDSLANQLIKLTKVEGPANSGNEQKRGDFVNRILVEIIDLYENSKVKLRREKQIEGDIITGQVEFVIVDKKSVLVVVEAKKESWELGRAQNMMEIYTAYYNNINGGYNDDHIVFGCITTGDEWEIISCQGKDKLEWKFYGRYKAILTNTKLPLVQWKYQLRPLVEKLNYMLYKSVNKIYYENNVKKIVDVF
jgi:hypothetical protein